MRNFRLNKGFLTLAIFASYMYGANLDITLSDILRTNPDILEKQKVYNGAISDVDVARSGYFPTLVFEAQGGYQNVRDGSTSYKSENDSYYEAKITARQTLYDWGRVSADKKAKNAYVFSSLYGYLRASSDIAYKSIKAYIDVLKYHELEKLAVQNVQTHQNILKSVKMRMDAGKQGRSEMERVLGRLATARTKMLLRQSEYERALHVMHKYLGRFTDFESMSEPIFDEQLLPVNLKQAFETQISLHPAILQGSYAIKQREFEHERQKDDRYGKLYLELSGKVHDEGKKDNEHDAYVALRYDHTLYDGGKRSALSQKYTSLVHEEQQKQLSVKRVLNNDLQLTWSAYKLLYSQIGELKKSLYFTKKALQTYKEEFRIGRRLLITILDAQNEYQNAKEQLESMRHDLISEKFRVLYAQGTLLRDLNLLTPQMKTLLKHDEKLMALSEDTLPLKDDFDEDGVKNEKDLSVNNIPKTLVNALGVDEKMMKLNKIDESVEKQIKNSIIIIKSKEDMIKNPLKAGIMARFDFVSFKPKSMELSENSKDTMRYLIEQIKNYASEGMLYIKVGTHEFDDEDKNRNLALSRAYNFKRILQAHNIDKDSIQVFADTKTKEPKSYLGLKIINSSADYKSQYSSHFFQKPLFAKKTFKLTKEGKNFINNLAKDIKHKNTPYVDMVIYSNDFKNPIRNRNLSIEREKILKDELAKNGIDISKVFVFGWGEFKEYNFLVGNTDMKNYNKIEYVLRN